ncbi:MAG: hypothetical protein LH702_01740 [Phormidesmis sp. CAN_BIN44]|nr:hypothetical protein [Phormidesmis sp. CAN_BIN44]
MTDKPSEKQDVPFQAPNPDELKQAEKDDPLQTEYLGSKEATVADVLPQGRNMDQPDPTVSDADPETLEDQQIIHAKKPVHSFCKVNLAIALSVMEPTDFIVASTKQSWRSSTPLAELQPVQ